MSTTDRWKGKYLNLIDDHEKLEKRFEDHTAQLRRALIRLTLLAEGRDDDLDHQLEKARILLRKEQITGLSRLLDSAEKGFEHWQANQESFKENFIQTLIDIETKHEALPTTLTKMVKEVRKQVRNTENTELLVSLSGVIARWADAMADHMESTPAGKLKNSWLGRLFSKEQEQEEKEHREQDSRGSADASGQAQQVVGYQDTEENQDADIDKNISTVGQMPYEINSSSESKEGLNSLGIEASRVLGGLISQLSLPDPEQPRAVQLLNQVNAGLSWYELVPALEVLSDLVVSAMCTEQKEFEAFLKTLNERLTALQTWLYQGEALETKFSSASKNFDNKMRGHLDELKGVLAAGDTQSLKGSVSHQLDEVFATLDTFKLEQKSRETEFEQHINDMGERLQAMQTELEEAKEQLNSSQLVAMTDSLTQLPNRGAYDVYVAREYERYRRYGGELSLLICDVDKFKLVNDSYGHQAGDKVLQLISQQVKKGTRGTDFLARYGGEEFVVILPGTDAESAWLVGEKIRKQVASSPFHFKGTRVQITISCGIASFAPGYRVEQVFEAADKAMYKAKETGRNQCSIGELEGKPAEGIEKK